MASERGHVLCYSVPCKFNSSRFHMKKEGREREEGGLLGASSYIIKQTNTH